ncbi:MAG: peptidase M20, partial [Chloroflexota bacterium]
MQDVYNIIEERKDIYLEWLRKLCMQPSVAAQDRGMSETAAMVEQMLKDIGADVKQIPTAGYPVVYGEISGKSNRTLSF